MVRRPCARTLAGRTVSMVRLASGGDSLRMAVAELAGAFEIGGSERVLHKFTVSEGSECAPPPYLRTTGGCTCTTRIRRVIRQWLLLAGAARATSELGTGSLLRISPDGNSHVFAHYSEGSGAGATPGESAPDCM